MNIECGNVIIELMPEMSPNSVKRFKYFIKKGSYNGSTFYRVVKDTLVQAGDLEFGNIENINYYKVGSGRSMLGNLNSELNDNYQFIEGTVALARGDEFNTEDSEFFIILKKILHFEKRKVVISDTVGFIRKLPTQLIESFKSTLQEVKDADILLHIVDISHTSFEEHIDSVDKILQEINCHNKYTLMVFNKIDNYNNDDFIDKNKSVNGGDENMSLVKWKNTWMNKTGGKALFISATKKLNIENFKKQIYQIIKQVDMSHYPKNDYLYPEYFSKS